MSQRTELLLRPKWLDLWPGQASKIEPTTGSTPGIPDVHLVASGFPFGFVEFKAEEDGLIKMEKSQVFWMREFAKYSSRCAIVILSPRCFLPIGMGPILEAGWCPAYDVSDLGAGSLGWQPYSEELDLPKLLETVYAQEG